VPVVQTNQLNAVHKVLTQLVVYQLVLVVAQMHAHLQLYRRYLLVTLNQQLGPMLLLLAPLVSYVLVVLVLRLQSQQDNTLRQVFLLQHHVLQVNTVLVLVLLNLIIVQRV